MKTVVKNIYGGFHRKGKMKKRIITLLALIPILLTSCSTNTENADETTAASSESASTEISETLPESLEIIDSSIILSETWDVVLPESACSNINNKECTYNPFCFDPESGVVYFANDADNQYIYSYDGISSKCILEKPSFSLTFYDNCIYFLSVDCKINVLDWAAMGYPYKYDLKTGELKQLTDAMGYDLRASSAGIQYIDLGENNRPLVFKIDEKTATRTLEYVSFSIMNIGEYYYFSEVFDHQLKYYLTDGVKKYLLPFNDIPRRECIYNGVYYYTPQYDSMPEGIKAIRSVDLSNGEYKEIFTIDGSINDYNFLNGEMYAILDHYLYIYRDGDFVRLDCDQQFDFLYSSSDKLYAITLEFDGERKYYLNELIFSEDKVSYKNISC